MTKQDFALLGEGLEQAVEFKQEDANNRQKLVLKNGSIIEHIPCEGEVIRGKGWFIQN